MQEYEAYKTNIDPEVQALLPNQALFEVMSPRGDDKYIFDVDSRDSVDMAKKMFDEYKKKGYLAYKVVGEKGDKGDQMHTFDEKAGRIIFSPPLKGG